MKTGIKAKMVLMRFLLDFLRLKRISENNHFSTVKLEKALSQKIIFEIETIKYKEDNPHL